MRTKLHFLSDGASARLSDIVAAACNPLKTLEWVKGIEPSSSAWKALAVALAQSTGPAQGAHRKPVATRARSRPKKAWRAGRERRKQERESKKRRSRVAAPRPH
jgi:hypothetical protein